MQRTGIVRKIDELGRIVLPVELRRLQGIDIGTPIEFYEDGRFILIKTYQGYSCTFCGNAESNLLPFKGKLMCSTCQIELKSAGPTPAPKVKLILQPEGIPAKRVKQSKMLEHLLQLLRMHPKSSQKELGQMLGVSVARVSQLCKALKEQSKRS